ncbi:MAG: hypothetical protein PHD31_01135 [Candidatus Pacebacteria bacterium]|nr:hypothetical protein [Candidatus Paceibacterota bacterium]
MRHIARGDASIPMNVTRKNKKLTTVEEKKITVKIAISIDIPKSIQDVTGKSAREMRKEIKKVYGNIADLIATQVVSTETVAINNSDVADSCSEILYEHIDMAIQETAAAIAGDTSNKEDSSSTSYG